MPPLAFQVEAALKVNADKGGLYFKSGADPVVAASGEAEEGEEPGPAATRAAAAAAAAAAAPGTASLSGERVLRAGDCLPGTFKGKACYLRLDKKLKKSDEWTVGVCSRSAADSGGEKPRATGGKHKMTSAEVRAALVEQ